MAICPFSAITTISRRPKRLAVIAASVRNRKDAGYGWVVNTNDVEHKRPLFLGDKIIVRTWIEEMLKDGVNVRFGFRKRD